MIHRCFTLLTVAAVLAHALLGCCWHHAHAETLAVGAESTSHVHHGGQLLVFHSHAADEHDGGEGDGHHPHHPPCDEGSCTFLTAADVKLPELTWVAWVDGHFASLCDAPATAAERYGERGPASECGPPRSSPGLRLHAANRVWLL